MRSLAILAIFAAVVPWSVAQRGGAAAGHGAAVGHLGSSGRPASRNFSRAGSFALGRGSYSRFSRYGEPYSYLSLPFPFFGDYDSGDPYSTGYPVAAPLPPYLPPPMSGRYSDSGQAPEPSQPLMIELQNGRYVQVSSAAIDGEARPLNDSNDAGHENSGTVPSHAGPMIAAPASENLAPVILFFRDGHSEQVRDYTIAEGTLYARGDYYTDGYWNKKIDLSGLNVPETLQANAAHGVNFVLPSSPNEVITRP
jgi:hypothetical protein